MTGLHPSIDTYKESTFYASRSRAIEELGAIKRIMAASYGGGYSCDMEHLDNQTSVIDTFTDIIPQMNIFEKLSETLWHDETFPCYNQFLMESGHSDSLIEKFLPVFFKRGS